MDNPRIRIELKSYYFNLVEKSSSIILQVVKTTCAIVNGPICLPIQRQIFTVLRSPHVNKKSREQDELLHYKIILDIYSYSYKTVDALIQLELPSGVELEIKV